MAMVAIGNCRYLPRNRSSNQCWLERRQLGVKEKQQRPTIHPRNRKAEKAAARKRHHGNLSVREHRKIEHTTYSPFNLALQRCSGRERASQPRCNHLSAWSARPWPPRNSGVQILDNEMYPPTLGPQKKPLGNYYVSAVGKSLVNAVGHFQECTQMLLIMFFCSGTPNDTNLCRG